MSWQHKEKISLDNLIAQLYNYDNYTVARNKMVEDGKMRNKPTIEELERILDNEEEVEVEILPNGEIREKYSSSSLNLGTRKPITMREDLGGEYSFGRLI